MKVLFQNVKGLGEVERRLRQEQKEVPSPADLHDRIVGAIKVRKSATVAHSNEETRGWFPWATVAASAVCIVAGLMLLERDHGAAVVPSASVTALAAPVELSTPGVALNFGNKLPEKLPAAVSPLATELDRVQTDLARTAAFLLASLPGI